MTVNKTFHYVGCGLPNVYLANGFTYRDTPFGRTVSIENLAELHECIAAQVTSQSRLMTGAELKFIRTQLKLSRKTLGEIVGFSDQVILRRERAEDKPIPKAIDLIVRTLYKESRGKSGKLKTLLEKLQDLDNQVHKEKLTFEESPKGWVPSRAA